MNMSELENILAFIFLLNWRIIWNLDRRQIACNGDWHLLFPPSHPPTGRHFITRRWGHGRALPVARRAASRRWAVCRAPPLRGWQNKNAYTGMTSVCKSCLLQSDDFILPSPFLPWKAPLQNCPPESNISVNICHKVKWFCFHLSHRALQLRSAHPEIKAAALMWRED